MKRTILILAYNADETIDRAIESAYKQDCDEILVVDDGSKNPIKPGKHKVLRFDKNHGCVFGLNKALIEIGDGLVLRVDADDSLPKNALKSLAKKYKPETFVYGSYTEIPVEGPPKFIRPINIWQCLAGGVLVNVSDIKKCGGYALNDVGIFVEYDLYARLIHSGIKPKQINRSVYNYYRQPKSITSNNEAIINSLLMFEKKWGLRTVNQIRNY